MKFKHNLIISALLALMLLLMGCGLPKTGTPVPILSTDLPIPTMMPTQVPPDAMPTPVLPGTTPTLVSRTATPVPPVDLEQVVALDLPDSFVNTIVFSPDNRTMITGDRNGEVLVWQRETWEKSTFLPARSDSGAGSDTEDYFAGTLALSPDGTIFITVFGDDGVVTGNDPGGNELFSFSYGAPVYGITVSPDGRFLAMGGFKTNVLIFDLESRQPAADLVCDHEYITNLVFSRDGKRLAVSYERPGNVIKIWDTITWQETATLTHTTERFDYHDMLFSPDGKQLVIASTEDVEIQFLDLATQQIVRQFPEHSRASYQLAFSPDDALLASAADDGTLRLWDMETGINFKTIRVPNGELGAVAFSSDGSLLAFSIWGVGVQVWSIVPAVSDASLAPSSSQSMGITDVLPITSDSAVQVELLHTLEDFQGRVWTLAFSADGVYFASADRDSLDIWDASSGQQLFGLGIQDIDLNSFAFSPDGRLVATGYTIWDVKSQQPIHRLDTLGLHPAFSPDGTLLAVSGGRPIKIWDAASGQLLRTFELQADDDSFNIAFSPDGKWLADSGHDGQIRLWDVASGQVVRSLAHSTGNDVHDFAFSPDGKWLVSVGTDYAVRLWDFASGQILRTMTHSNGLYGVAFSPDGSLVASASCDRTVKLWDAASGKMLVSLRHGDEVTAVAFSPDSRLLVSADYLQKIYLWGIPH